MNDLEALFTGIGVAWLISFLISLLVLITFFVMASNISKIRRALELRMMPGPITRSCTFCLEMMRRSASVCPNCHRESRPWRLERGYWWTENDAGDTLWLDEHRGTWVKAETSASD